VGEILKAAFSMAQAFLVLMTLDEQVVLRPELRKTPRDQPGSFVREDEDLDLELRSVTTSRIPSQFLIWDAREILMPGDCEASRVYTIGNRIDPRIG